MKLKVFIAAMLTLAVLATVALAWPPPGQQVPPGTYILTQTNPAPPPATFGGILDVGPGPGPAQWTGNDGTFGPAWWDSIKNAYELPNGDYLFMYPGPPRTWVRTDMFGNVLASGTY